MSNIKQFIFVTRLFCLYVICERESEYPLVGFSIPAVADEYVNIEHW